MNTARGGSFPAGSSWSGGGGAGGGGGGVAASFGGGGGGDVNIFDSAGNVLNSTSGALNVHLDSSSVNSSVSATGAAVPGFATYAGAIDLSGNLTGLKLGQQVMNSSLSVVIASNQTAIPITGSITATNPSVGVIGATAPSNGTYLGGKDQGGNLIGLNLDNSGNLFALPLPSGASTETTLAALNGKFGSLGQKTMAGSAPVTFASDQSILPVSVASLPLPAGAATAANQATEIASLASIDGKLVDNFGSETTGLRTAAQIGNATGAADFNAGNKGAQTLRVVIASDQSTIPVSSGGNSNGSNVDTTVSTVATITAPANTVGFILMNLDTSSANIRYRIGATATSSSGQQLQPGRDTGYIPCAANISICAESGTQNYNIQWILSV